MGELKFVRMTREDYETKLNGEVRNKFATAKNKIVNEELNAESIFGYYGTGRDDFPSAARDNNRGYLTLVKPIPNLIICRTDGSLFCKIFGITTDLFSKIVKFDLVYSRTLNELVPLSEISNAEDMMCSGEYIKHLIDGFNLEGDIHKDLLNKVKNIAFKSKANIEDIGTISKGAEGIELIADYRFLPGNLKHLKKDFPLDSLTDIFQGELLASGEDRLSFLLNTDKDTLYSFIQERVSIIPSGMRPNSSDRILDQFTVQYGRVLAANENLRLKMSNNTAPDPIYIAYKKLTQQVLQLTTKSDETAMNEFSVKERLQGKKGLIRGKLISKRGDYTGRSAVIINPKLELDQCGLPVEMIPKLYRHHHLASKPEYIREILEDRNNLALSNEILQLGILDNIPVAINRAPTLHSLSYLAYWPVISQSKAIEVNCLVHDGYNMDHDGDTAAVAVPVTANGIRDMKELVLATHNLFKPATGKCTLVPRMEMLYGLFIATRGKYNLGKSIATLNSYEELAEHVYSQKVKISDTVTYKGKDIVAGYALVESVLPDDMDKPISQLNDKSVNLYLGLIIDLPKTEYLRRLDNVKELALKISNSGFVTVAKALESRLDKCRKEKDFKSVKNKLGQLTKSSGNELSLFTLNLINCNESEFLDQKSKLFNLTIERERRIKDNKISNVIKELDKYYDYYHETENYSIEKFSKMRCSQICDQAKQLEETRIKNKHKVPTIKYKKFIDKGLNELNTIKSIIVDKKCQIFELNSFDNIEDFFKELDRADKTIKLLLLEGKLDLRVEYLRYTSTIGYKGKTGIAGNLLVAEALGVDELPLPIITKRTIYPFIDRLLDCGLSQFKKSVFRLCTIGFELAKIYAPTLAILTEIDEKIIKEPFDRFHEDMKEVTRMYELGFEEENTYNQKFSMRYKKAEEEIEEILMEALEEDNGFRLLVESGARGDINNLLQIFSHKGRIARSTGEAFNAVIERGLVEQLTAYEHFISAYGSRKGMLDKSVKPGETGYLQRLMWHSSGDIIISKEDCGTTKGITISMEDLIMFDKRESVTGDAKMKQAREVMREFIVGRYQLLETEKGIESIYIDEDYAGRLCEFSNKITIRSPITCDDPCCAKCYGDDLSIQGKAIKGYPVGIVAAQSIGEPGTQTTMKTFQKGGVAGKADIGAPFDRLQDMVKYVDIRKRSNYDPVAWETGEITEEPQSKDITKKIVKIGGSKEKITIDSRALLKKKVIKGEGICQERGDFYIDELIRYKDFDYAMKYFVLYCFFNYKDDAPVNIKHFEVLCSAMQMYLVTKTDNPRLKIGQLYTKIELLYKGDLSSTKLVRLFKGVKDVPVLRERVIDNINMENIQKGLSRAVILKNSDNLEGPLSAIMFGLKPKLGSYFPGFIEERNRCSRCN